MTHVVRFRDIETGTFVPEHEAREICPTCWRRGVVKDTDGHNSWQIDCAECGGLGYVSAIVGKHVFGD